MVCSPRFAGARALLFALVLSLASTGLAPGARAQDPTFEVVFAKLGELEARIILLENELRQKEAERQENLVVSGTLTVVGKDGRSLLLVDSDGGNARIVVGQGSAREITLLAGSEGAVEIGVAGVPLARLFASDDSVELTLGQEQGPQARLYQIGSGGELKIDTDDGQTARLTQDASGGELVLGEDEGRAARLVFRPDGSELVLGQDTGKQVRLAETADGGQLSVGQAGAPALLLKASGDSSQLTLGKSGGQTLELRHDGGTGKLTVGKAGAPDVTLTSTPQGGQLLLGAGTEPKVELSSNDVGGQLQMGPSDGVRVQIGTRGEVAVLQAGSGDDRSWLAAGGEFTGLITNSSQGSALLGEDQEFFGVRLRQDSQPVVLLGAKGSEPVGLQFFSAGADPTVSLQGEGEGGTLLLGKGGDDAPVKLSATASTTELLLGKSGTKHVELITEADTAQVSIVDGSSQAGLIARGADFGIAVDESTGKVELGKMSGNWGVNLYDKSQLLAGLGTQGGGRFALRLYEDGNQVGAFGAAPDGSGGTLRIYAGGAKATATLGAVNGAGLISAYDAGGSPVLSMTASDHAFAVYNSAGVPIATLSQSSHGNGGNVTASDGGGNGVFSAGAASDGGGEACVVRDNGKGFCLGIGLPGMGSGN